MVHYTCDRCQKQINDESDHFVAVLEIRAMDSGFTITEEDVGEDNLRKISGQLKKLEASGASVEDLSRPVKRRLDLCGDCRREVVAQPLGEVARTRLGFSEN